MNDQDSLDDIRNNMREVRTQIGEIHKLLNGNGKIGLVGMVMILWRGHSWVVGLCGVVLGMLASQILTR
jgi:hypothetical protein